MSEMSSSSSAPQTGVDKIRIKRLERELAENRERFERELAASRSIHQNDLDEIERYQVEVDRLVEDEDRQAGTINRLVEDKVAQGNPNRPQASGGELVKRLQAKIAELEEENTSLRSYAAQYKDLVGSRLANLESCFDQRADQLFRRSEVLHKNESNFSEVLLKNESNLTEVLLKNESNFTEIDGNIGRLEAELASHRNPSRRELDLLDLLNGKLQAANYAPAATESSLRAPYGGAKGSGSSKASPAATSSVLNANANVFRPSASSKSGTQRVEANDGFVTPAKGKSSVNRPPRSTPLSEVSRNPYALISEDQGAVAHPSPSNKPAAGQQASSAEPSSHAKQDLGGEGTQSGSGPPPHHRNGSGRRARRRRMPVTAKQGQMMKEQEPSKPYAHTQPAAVAKVPITAPPSGPSRARELLKPSPPNPTPPNRRTIESTSGPSKTQELGKSPASASGSKMAKSSKLKGATEDLKQSDAPSASSPVKKSLESKTAAQVLATPPKDPYEDLWLEAEAEAEEEESGAQIISTISADLANTKRLEALGNVEPGQPKTGRRSNDEDSEDSEDEQSPEASRFSHDVVEPTSSREETIAVDKGSRDKRLPITNKSLDEMLTETFGSSSGRRWADIDDLEERKSTSETRHLQPTVEDDLEDDVEETSRSPKSGNGKEMEDQKTLDVGQDSKGKKVEDQGSLNGHDTIMETEKPSPDIKDESDDMVVYKRGKHHIEKMPSEKDEDVEVTGSSAEERPRDTNPLPAPDDAVTATDEAKVTNIVTKQDQPPNKPPPPDAVDRAAPPVTQSSSEPALPPGTLQKGKKDFEEEDMYKPKSYSGRPKGKDRKKLKAEKMKAEKQDLDKELAKLKGSVDEPAM